MTTYNSYEAAKIAMPLACIIHYTDDDRFFGMPSIEGATLTDDSCKLAEPADHCMTVEQFLKDGHKFVGGDVVFDAGEVEVINSRHDVEAYNEKERLDRERYILRAAALNKPKRTKLAYELLCNKDFNVWGLKELLDDGDLFYLINDEYLVVPAGSDIFAIEHFLSGNIYRRIETEITERDKFVEAVSKILPEYDKRTMPLWIGKLFDSGKFKLVDDITV